MAALFGVFVVGSVQIFLLVGALWELVGRRAKPSFVGAAVERAVGQTSSERPWPLPFVGGGANKAHIQILIHRESKKSRLMFERENFDKGLSASGISSFRFAFRLRTAEFSTTFHVPDVGEITVSRYRFS